MIHFQYLMRRLREVEPNNPQLTYFAQPNAVPSEAWLARLQAELAVALGRTRSGQPPPFIGNQLAKTGLTEQPELLIAELVRNGTKVTPAKIIKVERMPNGQIVFLEQGNIKAGLEHIIHRHGHEFIEAGISQNEIPDFLFTARKYGTIVGYQGVDTGRPIYEITVNNRKLRVAMTIGNNGYIVGANIR